MKKITLLLAFVSSMSFGQNFFCDMFCPNTPKPDPLPIPGPQPIPETNSCDEKDEICQIESLILKYTNEVRAKNGKASLSDNEMASYAARDWSQKQAKAWRMSHDGFPGQREGEIRLKYGVDVDLRAENVAWNSSSRNRSPDEIARKFVFDQWEKSPGHLKNMLGNFSEIGIGVAVRDGRYYATQIFL
jgi:uncharacterized protein YkwD